MASKPITIKIRFDRKRHLSFIKWLEKQKDPEKALERLLRSVILSHSRANHGLKDIG